MRCPRCKIKRDVLAYKERGQIEEYADVTNPIVQCPARPEGCGWWFSPGMSTSELKELLGDATRWRKHRDSTDIRRRADAQPVR